MADDTGRPANQIAPDTPQSPQFNPPAPSDFDVVYNPVIPVVINPVGPVLSGYPQNSILDMAYGANDPNQTATQLVQGGTLFRLERGTPYYRNAGKLVVANPQFRALKMTVQTTGSAISSAFTTTQVQATVQYPTKTK